MAGIYLALRAYGIHKGLGAAGVVFLASNLVQLFPITPGNLGVFQGATATSLSSCTVSGNLALTFSIGLQLIEAPAGGGRRIRVPVDGGTVGGRAATPGRVGSDT